MSYAALAQRKRGSYPGAANVSQSHSQSYSQSHRPQQPPPQQQQSYSQPQHQQRPGSPPAAAAPYGRRDAGPSRAEPPAAWAEPPAERAMRPPRAAAPAGRKEPQTVQVCVRLRPPLRTLDGTKADLLPQLLVDEGGATVQVPGDPEALRAPKAYKFNNVFGPAAAATEIYRDVLTEPVESLLSDGYSVAIFAYGQTGSGKTFTMAGAPDSPGIASLVFAHMFADAADRGGVYAPPMMKLSIMEIYKEVVYDLLNNRARVELKTGKGASQDSSGSPSTLRFVNLAEYPVRTQSEATELMARGMEGKTMGANYEHEHSSRSHTVVRLMVSGGGKKPDASLLLVDLAGSEAAHDNSSTKAMAEGKAIGKSLFQLRQCVHALATSKRPDYRVSKLTRLLEPALTRGTVSVICTAGIGVNNFRQVADTLEFGMQAQVVQLNPNADSGAMNQVYRLQEALHASEERCRYLERELQAQAGAGSYRAARGGAAVDVSRGRDGWNSFAKQQLQGNGNANGSGGGGGGATDINGGVQGDQRLRIAEDQAAQAQSQTREANAVKDMMEQQLLALMETGGSAEAALRDERRQRTEAEAKLSAMESQYESAVFALNERESGAVTERMLHKQKELRSHVREVEQALRARQEDEVRRLLHRLCFSLCVSSISLTQPFWPAC